MVSFEKIGKDKVTGRIALKVSKTSPAFMNALRRSIMESVPTMAIEHVEFRKNGSVLYDEMLAHRLGLIPLTTDLKGYSVWDHKTSAEEAPAQSSLKFVLKAKGPKIVYSKDLKSKDPKVVPVFDDIPIVTLLDGQDLEFEAVAVLSSGSDHSKFSPGNSWYRHFPTIKINEKMVSDAQSFVDSSPIKIFKVSGGKLVVDNDTLLQALVDNVSLESVEGGPISIEDSPDEFIFHFEPWGQLSPKDALVSALEKLGEEISEFQTSLKNAS